MTDDEETAFEKEANEKADKLIADWLVVMNKQTGDSYHALKKVEENNMFNAVFLIAMGKFTCGIVRDTMDMLFEAEEHTQYAQAVRKAVTDELMTIVGETSQKSLSRMGIDTDDIERAVKKALLGDEIPEPTKH